MMSGFHGGGESPADLWADLVGVPFVWGGRSPAGLDCLGLVIEAQKRLGRECSDPCPAYGQNAEAAFLAHWHDQWQAVGSVEIGDAILIRTKMGVPNHVGVYIGGGRMLHASRQGVQVARLEAFVSRRWVVGYFRHRSATPTPDAENSPQAVTVVSVGHGFVGGESWLAAPGRPIRSYVEIHPRTIVLIGDRRADPDEIAPAGSRITAYEPVHEPVSGTAATVSFLGATVFTTTATAAAIAVAAGNLAIGTLLSILLSLISAPEKSNLEGPEDGRPTFSLAGARNTTQVGTSIPIVYGEHRVAGQIIQLFFRSGANLESRLYMLIALNDGQVQSIAGLTADANSTPVSALADDAIQINGNDIKNFPTAKVSVRMGTLSQSPIPGFEEQVVAVAVDAAIDRDTATASSNTAIIAENTKTHTVTTTDDIDAFEILLRFPVGLYKTNTTGDTEDYAVAYTLRYRPVGNAAAEVSEFILLGPAQYRGDHTRTIRRQTATRDKYEISLTRSSVNDNETSRRTSTCHWTTLNEINSAQTLSYPGVALIAVEAVATNQLSGTIPSVRTNVKGSLCWIWDGVSETSPAFTQAWSDNPAWVALDILTNGYRGLGPYISLNEIDLQSFKDWADYCDVSIVTDGVTHARWQFDHVFDSVQDAWSSAQQVAAAARAVIVQVGAKYRVKIDQASTPIQMFGMGNIVAGFYRMSYIDTTNRPNFVEVQYRNRDLNYDQDVAQLDRAGATGTIRREVVRLIGVTRAVHAYRHCQYMLNLTQTISKTLSFRAPVDAINVEPGESIWFSHDIPEHGISGRIISATTTHVILDQAISGLVSPQLTVRVDDGGTPTLVTVTPTLGTVAVGAQVPITPSFSASQTPETGDIYAIGETSSYRSQWKVVRTRLNDDLTKDVECVEYDATAYNDDPGVIETFTDQYPSAFFIPDAPTSVSVFEVTPVNRDGTVGHAVKVDFTPERIGEVHDVWFRYSDAEEDSFPLTAAWHLAATTRDTTATIDHTLNKGRSLTVSVTPRGPAGTMADPERGVQQTVCIQGRIEAPGDPSSLTANEVDGKTSVRIVPADDFDIARTEARFSLVENQWMFAGLMGECLCKTASAMYAPHHDLAGYVMAKHISTSAIPSVLPATTAHTPIIPSVSYIVDGSITGAGWTGAGTSDTNFTLTGSDFQSDSSATAATWQSANTTFALAATHVRVHAFLDAHGFDDVTTWDDMWWAADSVQSQRRTMGGTLLDIPQPEQLLRWDDANFSCGSPTSAMMRMDGTYDWDVDYALKLEYSLSTDSGGTTFGDWLEYKGPFECVGKYHVRFRVTFTNTAGVFRVQLDGLYVQAVDLTMPTADPWDFDEGDAAEVYAVGTLDLEEGAA